MVSGCCFVGSRNSGTRELKVLAIFSPFSLFPPVQSFARRRVERAAMRSQPIEQEATEETGIRKSERRSVNFSICVACFATTLRSCSDFASVVHSLTKAYRAKLSHESFVGRERLREFFGGQLDMDPTKSKSRGVSCDMSPAAVERRLELVDELRELALDLSRAERLGPVNSQQAVEEPPTSLETHSRINEG